MNSKHQNTIILGAGVTGLACGYKTGCTIFEKNDYSGGICSSYYLSKVENVRSLQRRSDEEDFRFEYGGGHWIFGNDPEILRFIGQFDQLKQYTRKSSVYLKSFDTLIPFPMQNNLRYMPLEVSQKIVNEILDEPGPKLPVTMFDWCETYFGKTLSDLFFHPFHELYTAGLWKNIQPQDGYKSPVNREHIIEGAKSETKSIGYNVSFVYPEHGLSKLTSSIEKECVIHYGKEVVRIDTEKQVVFFQDGTKIGYDRLITTLPLNVMQDITGLTTRSKQDPYTSVFVLNLGAKRGRKAVGDQWIYFPNSYSGFHRIGFYHNVDVSFLPRTKRNGDYVSLYVEKAYQGGHKITAGEMKELTESIIKELRELDFITDVEVCDPTWIDVAYTWSYPQSEWRKEMLALLPEHNIVPVGRYARWKFQGILESLHDGLNVDIFGQGK